MYIKRIELQDFRNYAKLEASFSEKVNIFIGNNAQGKTNLLEGIYMNAMARSFKTSKDKELIRFGREFCRVRITSFYDDDDHVTEIVINKDGRKRRQAGWSQDKQDVGAAGKDIHHSVLS